MDGISSVSADVVSQSIEAVNQILKFAQAENLEIARKMITAQAEMVLGVESGKGEILDIVA